jgi:hypothetical protein
VRVALLDQGPELVGGDGDLFLLEDGRDLLQRGLAVQALQDPAGEGGNPEVPPIDPEHVLLPPSATVIDVKGAGGGQLRTVPRKAVRGGGLGGGDAHVRRQGARLEFMKTGDRLLVVVIAAVYDDDARRSARVVVLAGGSEHRILEDLELKTGLQLLGAQVGQQLVNHQILTGLVHCGSFLCHPEGGGLYGDAVNSF